MHTRQSFVTLVVLVVLATHANGQVQMLRLRPLDPLARNVLAAGGEGSEYFRSLEAIVGRSDLIVYVQTSHRLQRGVHGQLQFVAAVGDARYLRITLQRDFARRAVGRLVGT